MKFEINKESFYSHNPGKISENLAVLDIYPEMAYGKTGGLMSVSICGIEDDPESYITVEINKNQAKYIVGILKAYINEKDKHQ